MVSIDMETLMTLVTDFFTFWLITLPGSFIDATLDSGVLREIWVAFFGNSDVIRLALVFAIMGGVYMWIMSNAKRRTRSGGKM